jgi:SAM-dependent methyltransferase
VFLGPGAVPSGAFLGIAAFDVLAHGGPDEATVAEWVRILEPGGRVIVLVPDPAGRGKALTDGEWSGERPGNRTHDEWRTLFTAAGLSVHREGSDGLIRGPYGKIPPLLDPRTAPARTQQAIGTLFLNPGEGENAVFVLEKLTSR